MGNYTGSGSAFGFTAPANGSVAFTVDTNGHITVTAPGSGSGSVSSTGQANVASAGGGGGFMNSVFSFSGVFRAVGGTVAANGAWTATFTGGGGSGTWTAGRL